MSFSVSQSSISFNGACIQLHASHMNVIHYRIASTLSSLAKSSSHLERNSWYRFEEAIKAGRISKVEKIDECCVLAAVGHQMASRKGVAATMFSALAKANINIRSALSH